MCVCGGGGGGGGGLILSVLFMEMRMTKKYVYLHTMRSWPNKAFAKNSSIPGYC